jgi:membrane fusion protein, multidrug efflux system
MKNTIYLLLALFIASCGGEAGTPEEQLQQLKAEKTALEGKIATLEQQIGKTNKAPKIRTVGLSEVKTDVFRHYIDLQGKVDAEESVQATSRMPGALRRVLVKNGDNVRQGQLIAEIDDAVLNKNLAELEGQLKVAEDIFNRQKGLWDQKIGTEVQYIQAKNGKESLERTIATLREQMSMSRIYAPTSGTVDMVILKQGQMISPGMPLCNIVNLSKLKVHGAVTEAYSAKVKKGDKVQVFFPDLNKELTTTVTYVAKTINPMTRTFDVECALPAGADYRANQVAVMKIVDYQNPNAVVIPVNLIQSSSEGDFVLVAEKGTGNQAVVKRAVVKQGSNYNGQVEILSGLKKGEWVISTGFQDVNNGETVNF